ncbi:MAG: radical SAM-associated putative lipoprotein [Alistipes sp.]
MKNKLLFLLLSLLGMASCNDKEDDGSCMYGVPPSTYTIKGLVTDTEGTPISGIQIASKTDPNLGVLDPTTTNAQGEFVWASSVGAGRKITVTLTATDIDGAANGGDFATQATPVIFFGENTFETKEITIPLVKK